MQKNTEFRTLAELCEKLEATTKRNAKVDLTSAFLKELNPEEVEPAVSMLLGRAFPKWDQRELEVSWATLSSLLNQLTYADWSIFREAFSKTGDVGTAAEALVEQSKVKRQTTLFGDTSLTILKARETLEAMAETTGHGSRERKERLLATLLGAASPLEVKYLVKILIGDMRTGFNEGLMELTVSKAFSIPLKLVQEATMLTGDIGEVAALAKTKGEKGLETVGFRLFKPVKPMLAQTATDVREALEELGGEAAFEFKLDGARIQIHKAGDTVRVFSRRLTDVTDSLPEIIEQVRNEIKAKKAIVEGEVIAIGADGSPMLFQHLMRRFRRVHEIAEMTKEVPVKLYLFDVLYIDGQSLISMPYVERRRKLIEIAPNIPLTEQIITKNPEEAERFLKEAMSRGHEGLVAKKLNSPYTPGVRGKRWFKVKPVLEPLDLVIIAAEYGYGRRHDWLSDYYLAARDAETGRFFLVGKTFKGLTDAEIIEMTRRLKELTLSEEHRRVTVVPKIVVEVAYNEVQKSPKYERGMALRFARITRVRDDKTPEEADTIQEVQKIFEKQFEKKADY
ncbi:MAG TPA: ATP-dependent DNA ligase [Candidatus Krumholzibacteriaceae bacterium]|nr:ATP-dependent DNA ligase [Candidatus Krumholzibacteriaceae bacterium]